MNKRILAGTIFIAAAVAGNAHALSISGWGFKIGSVIATVNLQGVPNPTTQPTVAVVEATLDQIEYLCLNPNEFNVAPGTAGERTVYGTNQVDASEIQGKGKATVELVFKIDGPDAYPCVNPNWTYIEGSAAAKQITTTISYYFCSGDAKTDTDPCYDDNGLTITEKRAGVVEGVCTLNPVLRYDSYPYGPIPGQEYMCMETSSTGN